MNVLSWEEFTGGYAPPTPLAAAVGVFDGLHAGHRALIGRVLGRHGLLKGVVTFRDNPKKVLRPATFHGQLSTLAQRLEELASLGVELCVLIDFSGDFSKLAGRKFLSLLRENGDLRYLAVGADFRCGHRLDTGAEEIRGFYAAFGVEAEILQPLLWAGHPVSSSRIRKSIAEGRLEDATAMLGRAYEIDLRSATRAGESALPFSPAPEDGQVLPPQGAYRVLAESAGAYVEARAVLSAGTWSLELPGGIGAAAVRRMRLVSRE